MIYKIIAIVVFIVCVALGINHFAGKYTELSKANATLQNKNSNLEDTIKQNNETYEKNIKLMKDELSQSKRATEMAVANASESNKQYVKTKKELNEKTNSYNNLIANGYRLHDNFTKGSSNSERSGDNGQGINKENNPTFATVGDGAANNSRLSEGLTRYLITRSGQANEVVEQLLNVQEYAKKQHQWILNNCNAKEATN